MSTDNINAGTTEGHENIDCENHLGEEIIPIISKVIVLERSKVKIISFYYNEILDVLASLLQDENTVQALNPSVITSTAGNVSTHGNSTFCS